MEKDYLTNYPQPVNEDPGEKKKKKHPMLKYFFNISLVLIITGVALVLTLYNDFDTIMSNLANCNWWWILFIVGSEIIVSVLRGFVLFCFARLYTKDYSVVQGVVIDQVGTFYNAITPGATGGQIMQAYVYKKQGVPISNAVSIMAMYSIVYQIVLILYGIVSFIVKYDSISSIGSIPFDLGGWSFEIPIWPLTIIGFLLNLSVILLVLLMSYWRGFHHFIMGPCVTFFAKLKIVKNKDKARENLRIQVENFKIELKRLLSNIPFFILVFISFFLVMSIKFSVPYFVGLSLGNQSASASYWDAVFLSNYHQMVTGLIPIPGAAGVSEYFFAKLFCAVPGDPTSFYYLPSVVGGATSAQLSQTLTMSALVIWRTGTFAVPLFVAGLVVAFYKVTPKEISKKDKSFDQTQTFVDLQRQTFVERKTEYDTLVATQQLTREAIRQRLRQRRQARENSKTKTPPTTPTTKYDNMNVKNEDDSI